MGLEGRELYDVSFLLGMIRTEYGYIQKALGVGKPEFIQMFTRRLDDLDLHFLAQDVEPFLIEPQQKDRILYFRAAWQDILNG